MVAIRKFGFHFRVFSYITVLSGDIVTAVNGSEQVQQRYTKTYLSLQYTTGRYQQMCH